MDTCGCPTWIGDPICEKWTYWSLNKTTEIDTLINPDVEPFSFTVTVTEGETSTILSADGQLIVTNSGDLSATLSSVVILLEEYAPGAGNAPGPSGQNWFYHKIAIASREEATGVMYPTDGTVAVTAYGSNPYDYFLANDDSKLVLYDPDTNDIIALNDVLPIPATLDNDGDGLRDEDPPMPTDPDKITGGCWVMDNDEDGLIDEDPIAGIDNDEDGLIDEDPIDGLDNDGDGLFDEDDPDDDGDGLIDEDDPDDDGDGLTDEDGACMDAVYINFHVEFDVTGLGVEGPGDGIVPSPDDWRIDTLITFGSAGARGGSGASGTFDVNLNGVIDIDDPETILVDESEKRNIRTIQQRKEFDPPLCDWINDMVTLEDLGAFADEPDCVDLTSSTLYEDIYATEIPGTTHTFTVDGFVTCLGQTLQDLLDEAAGPDGVVTLSVTYPYNGGPAYFPHAYISNSDPGTSFDGDYLGWCVDTDHVIYQNTNYDVTMTCSYHPDAAALVEKPENLDLVNWIINQGYVGSPSQGGFGIFTYGDVQRAIWELVEDNQSTSGLGPWSQARVNEILADAYAYGEDFVPDCDEIVAVILNPISGGGTQQQVTIAQITLIEVLGQCCGCETTILNIATLTGEDPDLIEGSPASASFGVECTCDGGTTGIVPGDFRTQTQGGWGTEPKGNNPGTLLHANFSTVFINGLIVGDPDGPDIDDSYAILLTTAQAVTDYLPAGETPNALTADQTDPLVTSSGVFGGQIVAATINVSFDAAGVTNNTYPAGTLGTLIYVENVDADLIGLSVNEVLALANTAISGGGTPPNVTVSDLSDALAILNQNFVDGIVEEGNLALP
jgi:hypothetical protein